MVAPLPRGNEAVNDALLSNIKELQARLMSQMQGMGFDPYRNRFAQAVASRANEAQLLGNLMNVGSGGIQDFAQQWLNARLGPMGGGAGSYGGQDLSRGGIAAYLRGGMANNDPNNPLYQMLNTGDWDADAQMLQAVTGLANQGNSPLYQQAQQRVLDQWLTQARGATQTDQNLANRGIMDLYMGRMPAQQPGNLPAPGAGGGQQPGGAYNPGGGQQPGGGGQVSGPAFGVTPAPGAPTGGQPGGRPQQGISSWQQLLDQYRGDQRNWGTEGFRPTPQAFSIGGISYDPAKDQVRDWYNMSGSGRTTQRGNFMSQYLYYLQLLMNQRARGGNAALGFGANATDDDLARIAMQRLQGNIGGQSSGMWAA